MKILVTGAKGMFASDLLGFLDEHDSYDVMGLDRASLDITNRESVKNVIKDYRPDVIIHPAAQTNVDYCEQNPEEAYSVNTFGTSLVAFYARKYGANLVYLSSCGVFGDEVKEYSEYDNVVLKSVYARSKYLGEIAVTQQCPEAIIIRPGWLFGGTINHPKNFVYKRYLEAQTKDFMESTVDKWGCPTYTLDLAKKIIELIETDSFGLYHITNEGSTTRFDYVTEILKNFGLKTEVVPVDSSKFLRSAPVPDCEILDNMNLRLSGLQPLQSWKQAIKEYVNRIQTEISQDL